MEELFRFSVARAAERTHAATLPLERKTQFQDTLIEIATPRPNLQWSQLTDAALNFIMNNAENWIFKFISQQPDPSVAALKQLLADLQLVTSASRPPKWLKPIGTVKANINANRLSELYDRLADLFLALLIFRSIGPVAINSKIREMNLAPKYAELLLDRPSLDEIADLLRLIDLLTITDADLNLMTADDILAQLRKTLLLPPGIFSSFEKPVHAIGITDLLVVKQHIARYEAGEIARIENVLKGEIRGHSQKHTLSNERDIFIQRDTTTETDQELTSFDHVNIRNETENTVKADTKLDAGVHTQYGSGSFKIQADFTAAYEKSSSESKKFASDIANDITKKAAKKVSDRITQSETTKIIETFEENENQSFENDKGEGHVIGVYQWIEKVYLAQVFNYGKHMLFDIMVPEPAASLRKAVHSLQDEIDEPTPPEALNISPLDLSLDPANVNFYDKLVKKYQVTGVEPPPPETIKLTTSKVVPYVDDTWKWGNDTLRIDDGYFADEAIALVTWTRNDTDDAGVGSHLTDSAVNLVVGGEQMLFDWQNANPNGEHAFLTLSRFLHKEEHTISYAFNTNFVNELTLNLEIICKRTEELFDKWKLQTYEKIATRWQKLQQDYEAKMAALEMKKQEISILGSANPETNRQTERTELKRSCIAILDHSYDHDRGFDATIEWPPLPQLMAIGQNFRQFVDPDINSEAGIWVRWFEQAFEWDKIGYVFYPYYWGNSAHWYDLLNLKNDDPIFLKFLQAGYARVVIPVRNGFEAAVNFFMLTGIPWLGGGLPCIGDKGQNPLYLSIVEEMKENSGAPGDEKPVGDPWEIRLPTTLIKLRKELDGTTPTWTHTTGSSSAPDSAWTWKVDEPPRQP